MRRTYRRGLRLVTTFKNEKSQHQQQDGKRNGDEERVHSGRAGSWVTGSHEELAAPACGFGMSACFLTMPPRAAVSFHG